MNMKLCNKDDFITKYGPRMKDTFIKMNGLARFCQFKNKKWDEKRINAGNYTFKKVSEDIMKRCLDIAKKKKKEKKKPVHTPKKKVTRKSRVNDDDDDDSDEYDFDNSDGSVGYMQDTIPILKSPSMKYHEDVGIGVNQLALFIIGLVANKAFNIGFHANRGRELFTCLCPLSKNQFRHWRKYANLTFLENKCNCKNKCMTPSQFLTHIDSSTLGSWYHIAIHYFLHVL